MKKIISLIILAFGIVSANAQLTVYNNGNVNVGSTQQSSNVTLSVGDVAYNDTAYYVSLSLCNAATGGYNIGGEGNFIQKDNNTGNGDFYIQNASFTDNTTVLGKNIFAGKDVNRGAIPGLVRIQSGYTTFQAEQTVTIKNGFQVEKGASLKVNTNSK